MWDDASNMLIRIIKDFPESEYFMQSNDHLFNIYISKSFDLKKDQEYGKSISEFLKIFDFSDEIMGKKQNQIDMQSNSLFKSIPESALIESASELYIASEYNKALFLYKYIFENYPDSTDRILKNFLDSKMRVTLNLDHVPLIESQPSGSFKKEGFSRISFENKTEYKLMVYIYGPEYMILGIEKGTKQEVEITAGNYMIVAELLESGKSPFYGEITYEEGVRYREIYQPAEDEEIQ
ncbi:MAG: hypothetical protein M1308_11015 [Actinobacteria bacterium]|nr:hypothetical protein [Actinomycetota bacterium]